jgi:hypothetical protein
MHEGPRAPADSPSTERHDMWPPQFRIDSDGYAFLADVCVVAPAHARWSA